MVAGKLANKTEVRSQGDCQSGMLSTWRQNNRPSSLRPTSLHIQCFLSWPRCVDGPGEALVHFLTKPSSVPLMIYEFNL